MLHADISTIKKNCCCDIRDLDCLAKEWNIHYAKCGDGSARADFYFGSKQYSAPWAYPVSWGKVDEFTSRTPSPYEFAVLKTTHIYN
jgi:hypothetical protein